uniref:Uncharacterized protein n=1 Tax=Meloidogyne incognita TaxID=6306 RepID=A0A914MI50_MELIC
MSLFFCSEATTDRKIHRCRRCRADFFIGLTFRWFSFARNLNNLYKKHLKNRISV